MSTGAVADTLALVLIHKQGKGSVRWVSAGFQPKRLLIYFAIVTLCVIAYQTMAASRTLEIEKLMKVGKELGYAGNDLQTFIEKERKMLREEEKKTDAKTKSEVESLERKAKLDADALERKAHFEMDARRIEFDARKAELKSEEKKLQMQIELEQLKKDNAANDAYLNSHPNAKPPKLPMFIEGKDDLDAYLERFERYARSQKWHIDNWGINLSSLLTGKALVVYSTLPTVEANDYNKLKTAILKKYNLTESGFRYKFKTARPESNETATQYMTRLSNYLMRWTDLAGVGKNYKSIFDFFVIDQFMQSIHKELAMFIRERVPQGVEAVAKLVETYLDAHNGWGAFDRRPRQTNFTPRDNNPKVANQRAPSSKTSNNPTGYQNVGSQNRKPPICHFCRKSGHFWRQCPTAPRSFAPAMAMLVDLLRQEPDNETGQIDNLEYSEEYNASDSECVHVDGVQPDFEVNNDEPEIISFMKVQNDPYFQNAVKQGHIVLKCGHCIPFMSAACTVKHSLMPLSDGFIGDTKVSVLRDTGCSGVVVRRSLVPKSEFTGRIRTCILIDGTIRKVPEAIIYINTPYFVGKVTALCMEKPVYELILGNVKGVRLFPDERWNPPLKEAPNIKTIEKETISAAVETRSQKQKDKLFRPLRVSEPMPQIVTAEKLAEEQLKDPSLKKIREYQERGDLKSLKSGGSLKFTKQKGIIFREYVKSTVEYGNVLRQVVVPEKFREIVLHLAHESILGGHQGSKRTADRVMSNFYWPGIQADIKRYCRSCDICQRTVPKGRVTKVPLGSTPLIDQPFDRIAIDLVGPISPCSNRGHRYILVIVDYASRYPEAVPMKSIEAEKVAEELLNIYTRVGFPKEVLTDQGSQFTANVTKEISRLLSIRQMTTTPYNPKCNGLVERFNGTLKLMLKKMCDEKPKDWDRYVAPLLFAYRETPQGSTGFSPFELLFGRTVRGPMQILKELWTNENPDSPTKHTYQYVIDLRERLEGTCKLAHQELEKSQARYKGYYDRKSKPRKLDVGDEVLLLLPTNHNKLLMQWKGPFHVVAKKSHLDFTIELDNQVKKTFHINMLKKYCRRNEPENSLTCKVEQNIMELAGTSVIEEESYNEFVDETDKFGKKDLISLPSTIAKENFTQVNINLSLSSDQIAQLNRLIGNFKDVLTDLPGITNLGEHDIKLIDDKVVRLRPYPTPHALRDKVQDEIDSMVKMGIVEPSDSPFASPLVIVKKPDGSDRYCVDFRSLNAKTVFDAEPIPDQTEIFAKLANDRYFSKLDLSKGYWQIPMKEDCKKLTAFITHHGLYQFNTMPFGLVNAAATFSRVMRKLLKGLDYVDNYIDDILIHTQTFEGHLQVVNKVFKRLRNYNLTARPTKCFLAYDEVEFLGHVVGKGQSKPRPCKIEAVQNAKRPETKSQMRSFLGLSGYYRSYIPNYAQIAAPLTDKIRKGEPNKVKWENSQEVAFQTLKTKLTNSPILHLPNLDLPFILRTDASDVGMAAVLLQSVDGTKFPVCYASKKFNKSQRNYSVIEKECLAIIWGIQKFEAYLYGRQFIIETDHQPLLCIKRSKIANGRIMRWALALQPYRYRIVAIKGTDNLGADFLSRAVKSG